MTDELSGVGDTEDKPALGHRPQLWLLIALSLLACGGVAVAWSQPANNELRVAATEQEFFDALDALKTEWYCTTSEDTSGDSVGLAWADCNLGSDGTRMSVEYWEDLDGSLALTAEQRERDPAVFSSVCTYIGDHVAVTWQSASATDQDVRTVAEAFDGWQQWGSQRDCP